MQMKTNSWLEAQGWNLKKHEGLSSRGADADGSNTVASRSFLEAKHNFKKIHLLSYDKDNDFKLSSIIWKIEIANANEDQ